MLVSLQRYKIIDFTVFFFCFIIGNQKLMISEESCVICGGAAFWQETVIQCIWIIEAQVNTNPLPWWNKEEFRMISTSRNCFWLCWVVQLDTVISLTWCLYIWWVWTIKSVKKKYSSVTGYEITYILSLKWYNQLVRKFNCNGHTVQDVQPFIYICSGKG